MRHFGPIAGIASTERYIATAGYDNQLILWDAASHRAVARALHDHLVNNCAFSSDGALLVSASSDFSARIWDVPSLRLRAALIGNEDDVEMAVFSPDDCKVATCALDRTIRIFDTNGRCLTVLRGHTGNIRAVAWTRDARRIVSTGVDGVIFEWDVTSGEALRKTSIDVRADTLVIDGDGRIVAGDDRGRILVIADGVATITQAHDAGVKRISCDADSRVIVTLSYDRSLGVWRIKDDNKVEQLGRAEIPAAVWPRSAAVIGPGRVAVGTFGTRFGVFNWKTDSWDMTGVEAGSALNAVTIVNGDVYSVGDAGIVKCNDRPVRQLGSLCNFLTSGGDRLFSGGQQGILFDACSGEHLHQHHAPLNCAQSFRRCGRLHLAVGAYTGEALIFDLEADERPRLVETLKLYRSPIKALSVSETQLFSVCASTDVAWHSLEDLHEVRRIPNAHTRIANGCCAAGENSFASVGRDRKLRIWTDGAEEVFETPHPNSVKCICASDDRMTLMTGAYTGTVAGFDMKTRAWGTFVRPTASGISSLAFDSARGRFLAASYDGGVYDIV